MFLQTFPRTDLLLDNESQGSGVFLPELEEPEYCNAQNTALWELHTLRGRAVLSYSTTPLSSLTPPPPTWFMSEQYVFTFSSSSYCQNAHACFLECLLWERYLNTVLLRLLCTFLKKQNVMELCNEHMEI